MPKKKKSQRSLLRQHAKKLSALTLLVVILAVAYLVVSGNHNEVEAGLTAPLGTTTRATQLETSELNDEQGIDEGYDKVHVVMSADDNTALANFGEAVRDGE